MTVTKEQWAEIERNLSGPFGEVSLICDGYQVTAQIQSIAPLKQGIVIFVNGVSKGEWFKGEAEEARKFLCAKTRHIFNAKDREHAQAQLKRRFIKSDQSLSRHYNDVVNDTLTHWYPYWTSAKAFCRHLRKTCTEIEVVKIGYKG